MKARTRILGVLWLCAAVAACGGGGDGGGGIGGGGGGDEIDVSGVVTTAGGIPLGHFRVAILGHDPVLTDANGAFTVEDVSPPYDVAVVHPTVPTVWLYRGLTRTNPKLAFSLPFDTPAPFQATVSGALTGGVGLPEPANHKTLASVIAEQTLSNTGTDGVVNEADGTYSETFTWQFGAGTTRAHATFLQFEHDAGVPTIFTGYATLLLDTVAAGDMVAASPIPLAPVNTTSATGTVLVPPAYTIFAKAPVVEAPNFGLVDFQFQDTTANAWFGFTYPVIPERPNALVAVARGPEGTITAGTLRGIAPDATGLTLDLPAAPVLLFPVPGTVVDADTVFWSSGYPVGVNVFAFFPVTGGDGPHISVVTDATEVGIPDLSEFGISLPPDTEYFVSAQGLGPFDDVDDATGPDGFLPPGVSLQAGGTAVEVVTAP